MTGSIDSVVVRIESELPLKGENLSPYWQPGGEVFEALRKNGWIDNDGTVILHFRMDEVRVMRKPNAAYEAVFNYHLVK